MHADKESEIGFIAAIGPFAAPPPTKYERLVARAKEVPAARTIVVHPCDETSLRGPVEAAEAGLIVPILVGPPQRYPRLRANTAFESMVSRSSTCPTAKQLQ